MDRLPFSDEDVATLTRRLEGVARELVFEPGSAQDLVQEAWLAALRTSAHPARHPLQWMKVVMRRRSLRERAREVLRRECEELAARMEATRDDEAFERASSAAFVLRELAELRSPFRDVLRARFLEERSVREIADRYGRSPETVRSQLHRGLTQLRERLDRRSGSRGLWAGMLLGVSGLKPRGGVGESAEVELVSRGPLAPAIGALVAAPLLLVGSIGLAAWFDRPGASASAPDAPALVDTLRSAATTASGLPHATRESFAVVTVEPSPPTDEPEAVPSVPADVARLRLSVRDALGAPVVDIDGDFFGKDRKSIFDGKLDTDGTAVIDIREEDLIDDPFIQAQVVISVRAPQLAWSDTLGIELELGAERFVEVTLDQPSHVLQGFVIDPDWKPVAGARVIAASHPTQMRLVEAGMNAIYKAVEVRTDAEGHFWIDGLPPVLHNVRVVADGFLRPNLKVEPATPEQASDCEIVLAPSARLRGTVTYADGEPARGAVVWVPGSFLVEHMHPTAQTDEHGRYRLSGFAHDTETRVFVRDVRDPTLFEATTVRVQEGEEGILDAVLRPSPGVRVRVQDSMGVPARRAIVVASAEKPISGWAARVVVDEEGRGVLRHVPDESLVLRVFPTAFIGLGDPDARRRGVRPSAEEYVLTLGAGVPLDAELAGRVLRADGVALVEATAYASLEVTTESAFAPPNEAMRFARAGERASSVDAEGSFLFQELEPGRYRVRVLSGDPQGAGILDAGTHIVLAGQRTDIPTLRAPTADEICITRDAGDGHGDGVAVAFHAYLGQQVRSFMVRNLEEDLDVRLFPGRYVLRAGTEVDFWDREFRVDGNGGFAVALRRE